MIYKPELGKQLQEGVMIHHEDKPSPSLPHTPDDWKEVEMTLDQASKWKMKVLS